MARLPSSALLAAAAVAGVVWILSSDAPDARPDAADPRLRVLFVGNSLTATNDLPAEVAALARATGRAVETRAVVFDGFSLEDHWNQGEARQEIESDRWDVAVLQQGPSAEPASQVHLRRWSRRFAALARESGTRTALLTVWPESYRLSALGGVIASYRNAAEAAGAELFPAGDAWRRAWACDPQLELHGSDGFHPSALGTRLAALVVYGELFEAPLMSPVLAPDAVTPRTARLLQASAASSLGRRVARRCGD